MLQMQEKLFLHFRSDLSIVYITSVRLFIGYPGNSAHGEFVLLQQKHKFLGTGSSDVEITNQGFQGRPTQPFQGHEI
jgi:hypothetical protein